VTGAHLRTETQPAATCDKSLSIFPHVTMPLKRTIVAGPQAGGGKGKSVEQVRTLIFGNVLVADSSRQVIVSTNRDSISARGTLLKLGQCSVGGRYPMILCNSSHRTMGLYTQLSRGVRSNKFKLAHRSKSLMVRGKGLLKAGALKLEMGVSEQNCAVTV
jgi:hypothetical protein